LCGMLASYPLFAVITGDASLRRRPMLRVIEPLSICGARFDSREGGCAPLAVRGASDALPIEYRLPVASAQVKSAILLAGLNSPGVTRVEEPEATRDHSENMLRHFGAEIGVEAAGTGRIITLLGQPELIAADIVVPGDPSSAAFPIVVALIVPGSSVMLRGVGLNPLRIGLFTTLREMGADIRVEAERIEGGEPVGDLHVRSSVMCGVDVPPERAPSMIDEYPVLAAAAACASGVTRMRGLHELRVKESDRLSVTADMLKNAGAAVTIEGDDLIVEGTGRPPQGGATIATHMDHRIAMTALVLGQATEMALAIDDSSFIDTSFPGFASLMAALGAQIGAD